MNSCASLTGEPFITPLGSARLAAQVAAGWTSTLQQQCLQGAFADFSGWHRAWIDDPVNTFESVTSGRVRDDPAVTQAVMTRCVDWQSSGGSRS